jgi:3D (Asp-Asp-Asp) domain-containing protein
LRHRYLQQRHTCYCHPRVIPLGSRLYIEYPDGTGHYATAEDTGGAIKGNRIDVAVGSVDKAYDFGIKNVKVYVVDQKA